MKQKPKYRLKNKLILSLEDKPDRGLSELENGLTDEGAIVWHFEDSKEFLDYIRIEKGFYDLCLIDLKLSDDYAIRFSTGGKEIINLLKRIYPRRPVICRSGYGSIKKVPKTQADITIIKDLIPTSKVLKIIDRLVN